MQQPLIFNQSKLRMGKALTGAHHLLGALDIAALAKRRQPTKVNPGLSNRLGSGRFTGLQGRRTLVMTARMAVIASGTNRARVKIAGRVQGVYFRASACQEAQTLGITGWVRNCSDGSVELVAEGAREKLDQFIAWCHRGPAGARIADVSVRWENPEHSFHGFVIKR